MPVRLADLLGRLRPGPRLYAVGGVEIALTPDHALPRYQQAHPGYDRFLPHLARTLPQGAGVIDVGANVGDTLAALAGARPDLGFVAVEPSPDFLPLLHDNIARMRALRPDLRVEVIEAFLSDGLGLSGLSGGRGTARAVAEGGDARNVTLDEAAARAPAPVALVKSDTDGYDWSVLGSGPRLLHETGPDLFFECEIGETADGPERHARLCRALAEAGYGLFHVFDNFGGPMLRLTDPAPLAELFAYVRAQNAGTLTRTIHYVDVLAVRPGRAEAADAAVAAFSAAPGAGG